MNRRRLLRKATAIVAAVLAQSAIGATADDSGTVQAPSSGRLLPRNVIVPLAAANNYFPEMSAEDSTGADSTAVGNPVATRSVIFTNSDGAQKLTLSVDQYSTAGDASAAYQQAVQGSENAPGFNPLPPPNLGQQAHAGTSTNGIETHFGLGFLDGQLIMAATIAGFDVTADRIGNLVALAQVQSETAHAALGVGGG